MEQNELKIKKKCLIGPCYGTKHAGKSEEMSHRSKETSGYGTKRIENQEKMSHRPALWDKACWKIRRNVP
ncbi:hypothetical protein B4064_3201 [Caldibacillus thermoamylovorans]|nr:hypothetical protein B4064_3201 [Caldibacillus thermoamylovorans]